MKPLMLCPCFFLFSCQNSSGSKEKEQVKTSAQVTAPNFDKILKCENYSYDENYFLTADAGCLYNPKGRTLLVT